MKNLVLGSLIAVVVSQAAGCIISSGGDGPDEYATITATWTLKNQLTGVETTCPAGYGTAALYSQPVDRNNQPVGSPIIDLYDCADGAGRTAPLPPNVYQVWVEITSGSGGSVYAQSLSAIVDVIDVDKTFSTTILNDGGYFSLSWELYDATTNAALECSADPNIDGVETVATLAGTMEAKVDKFNCEDHYGVTAGLVAGTYTVLVDAFQDGVGALGASVKLENRVIGDRNQVTDLGTINIPIN